jgi:type IV pilus assembly protein PilY1
MKRPTSGRFNRFATGAFAIASMAGSAAAAPLDIATVPLFLGGLVQPNLMLTIDDSNSMAWSYMPDSIGLNDDPTTSVVEGLGGTKRGLAAERNALAYNPAVIYEPLLLGTGGTNLTSFNAALNDGFDSSAGNTNLGSNYWPSWAGNRDSTVVTAAGPAFYYVFYANHPSVIQTQPANCDTTGTNGGLDDDDCYVPVVVSSTSGVGGTDETQNFANWYSYYRKRIYAVKSAARIALEQLSSSTRVGLGKLSDSDTVIHGIDIFKDDSSRSPSNYRTTVLSTLGGIQPAASGTGDTPLRRAADDIGQYFMTRYSSYPTNPWLNDPQNSGSGTTSCRRNFHLLMSDGYWNSVEGTTTAAQSDNDNDSAVVSGLASPGHTLADVAAYYWKTDLDGNSTNNNLATSAFNTAAHQHLVTIALSVGLERTTNNVDPEKAFANVTDAGITLNPGWPTTIVPNGPTTLDDFLHAAVNSRGDFINVAVPADLAGTLSRIVTGIPGSGSSSASVVLNSGALRSDTRLYQARFDSSDWTGELLAYEVIKNPSNPSQDGQIGSLIWDAGAELTSQPLSTRKIATYKITLRNGSLDQNNSAPAEFALTGLSTDQQNALTATAADRSDVVAYLRGTRTNESPNGKRWRKRNSLLGDIVNAAPTYLGPPSTLYPDIWPNTDANSNTTAPEDAVPYSAFRGANSARKSLLFAGANDGMLHAFEAAVWDSANKQWIDGSGRELYAYVPGWILLPAQKVKNTTTLSPLSDIPKANYGSSPAHRYLVDGSPTVGDAFFANAGTKGEWRTVLVSGLGGGGQAVFALDVTSPAAATDGDVKAKVLWEYTDLHNAKLGNTYSQPNIVRIPYGKGQWVALFGNGFNNTYADGAASTKGEALLIALDIETGAEVKTWGTPTSANSTSPPNGLATVVPIDVNGDFTADYAYAGDLMGNLWRFDLSSSGDGTLIYKALDPSGQSQRITTRPSVMRHPEGPGVIVLFGTGKYLETSDTTTTQTQTFYAIWDKDLTNTSTSAQVASATRNSTSSSLLQRKILAEVTGADGLSYRVTSTNGSDPIQWKMSNTVGKHLGWFMDLYNTENNNTSTFGERQVSDSIVRGGKVIFTTLVPNANACAFGGDGWLMDLIAATGSQPSYAVFDISKNGVFNLGEDYVNVPSGAGGGTAAPSGRKKPGIGIVPMPAILSRAGGDREFKYMAGSSGSIDVVVENPGAHDDFARESWQQHGVLE